MFEILMDEVETPQTTLELYFILKMVAENGIQINTITPKFTGDFYKGIDYAGNVDQFTKEFEQDFLVIIHAVDNFDLSSDLKLSIHSGSDKFSLYPHIHKLVKKHDAGEDGLKMVNTIYEEAYRRYDELTGPYKPVVHIDRDELPEPETFATWSGNTVVLKLTHDPHNPDFDAQLRQFLHCSYKIAAEQGQKFIDLLKREEQKIAPNVTDNLYERHIKPLFINNYNNRVLLLVENSGIA